MPANDAVKVDALCARILGDLGSIHRRVSMQADGRVTPLSTEMVSLRKYVRDVQDAVRDSNPDAFYK
jgi:hypothetical protein